MKLILIAVCGAAVVLLLAYAANAEFNVIQGRHISDAQEGVLALLGLVAVIIWGWIKWWSRSIGNNNED